MVYLDPLKPSFLGFPIMISVYKSKTSRFLGLRQGLKRTFVSFLIPRDLIVGLECSLRVHRVYNRDYCRDFRGVPFLTTLFRVPM